MTEHATTDTVTDTGASGDSAGDVLTFANEVFDAEDRNRVGSDQGMCVRSGGPTSGHKITRRDRNDGEQAEGQQLH